jgi:hypothetical protein
MELSEIAAMANDGYYHYTSEDAREHSDAVEAFMRTLPENALNSNNLSFDYVNNGIVGGESELMERIEKNLADYHKSLTGFGKLELIDMADKIAAMSDAHRYMTGHHVYDDDEIEFYLQFQNPLEVVADAWRERNSDIEDLSFTMDYVSERRDSMLIQYPLTSGPGAPADTGLRRFMNIDLFDFLGKISDKVLVHYPNDWNIDKDTLYEAASSYEGNKRFMWHVCRVSTHIKPERDVFIKDSGAFSYMTDYHQNDPDMFGYIVEVTGKNGQRVTGNVFEVGNYAEYAKYICDTALPLDAVTLTYSSEYGGVNSGKTITVSRREYDNDRHRVMSESGVVTNLKWEPADENELTALLLSERSRRMSLPNGSMEAHIAKLSAKVDLINAARDAAEIQAAPSKPTLAVALSRGKEKSAAYKAQKAPAAKKHKEVERD